VVNCFGLTEFMPYIALATNVSCKPMKQYRLQVLLILILISCQNLDSENNLIIGTWEVDKVEFIESGEFAPTLVNDNSLFIFKKDSITMGVDNTYRQYSGTGLWEVNDTNLLVNIDNEIVRFKIENLDEEEFIFTIEDEKLRFYLKRKVTYK